MENIKYPSGHLKYVQNKLKERNNTLVSIPTIHHRIKKGNQEYLDIVAEFVEKKQKETISIIAKKAKIKTLMEAM